MVSKSMQSLAAIHLAVMLFGLAGLLGKLLAPLSSFGIVAGRTFFAALTLAVFFAFRKQDRRPRNLRDVCGLVLLGIVLGTHWISFFMSVQVSTVAVALISFATFPVFVTFLEPLFFREPLRCFDLFTAAAVSLGLLLVVPEFDLGNHNTRGVAWGTLSGLTFAMLSVINRAYVSRYPAPMIALYQNGIAALLLAPVWFWEPGGWSLRTLGLLALLGIPCTALAHALFVHGLTSVRAQIAGLTAALEPVYGILFAYCLLGEKPASRTLLGGILILATAVAASIKRPGSPSGIAGASQ